MGLSNASIEGCKGHQTSTRMSAMTDTPPGEVPLAKHVLIAPEQEFKKNETVTPVAIKGVGLFWKQGWQTLRTSRTSVHDNARGKLVDGVVDGSIEPFQEQSEIGRGRLW